MIFNHPTEDVDDNGDLRVWSLTELHEHAQIYACHYGVDYTEPLLRWVVMESTAVYPLLLKAGVEPTTQREWDKMFERWRDSRLLTLHATFIQAEEGVVSSDNLFSHEIEEAMVSAVRRPQVKMGKGGRQRRSGNVYNN